MANQGVCVHLCFTLLAIHAQSPTSVAFIFQKELPYPLISDPKRSLIAALGAAEGGKTKRSHFVFAKGGKLVDKKIPVKPVDRYVTIHSNEYTYMILRTISCFFAFSPRLALEFIKSIQEGGEAPAS